MNALTPGQVPVLLRQAEAHTLQQILQSYTFEQIEQYLTNLHFTAICWQNWKLVGQIEKAGQLSFEQKTLNYRSALREVGRSLKPAEQRLISLCALYTTDE